MPFGFGIWEIVALLAVLALLFGTKGVPKMARKLGTSVRELKDSVAEIDPRTMFDADDDETRARQAQRAPHPQHDAPREPAPPQRALPAAPPPAPPRPQGQSTERDDL